MDFFVHYLKGKYSGGLNIENWDTENIGILDVLKFGFPMVQNKMTAILFNFPMVRTIGKPNF